MPVILSRKDLRELLTMAEVIEAVENGFGEYKRGRCIIPVRMPVSVKGADGVFLLMPAFLEKGNAFGTKIVSVFPENPSRGLPTIEGTYMLNDPTTGEFLALMDGIFLTAVRTGAASAVATKHLARKDASLLGILGTGAQAPFQVEAICAVRPIREILAFDTDREKARTFSKTLSKNLKIPVRVVPSPRDVVIHSDILTTVTTSSEPVFDGNDLKPGTHINAVGAFTPEMRELDDVTVEKAQIIVDTYDGCMAEAGDLLIPMRTGRLSRGDIHADLGEIVIDQKPGRTRDDEITLFESVGFALEDLVTARLAYQRAKERGIGLVFNLGESSPL